MPKKNLDYSVANKTGINKITQKWENNMWINFLNLDNTDKITLQQKSFGGLTKPGSNVVSFSTLFPKQPDNFKTKKIINAYEYLKGTGKYNMPSLPQLLSDIESAGKDFISKKDQMEIKKNTDKMWLDFMKKINEPETQELLKSMGQYSLKDSAYGWRIAATNIMRVKSQKPDATFVKTRKQWREDYNRRILPNATPISLIVPITKSNVSNAQKKEVMKNAGYDNDTSLNDLSAQQLDFVNITAMKDAQNDNTAFISRIYYDVSDTALLYPDSEDVFNNTVGFDNNLTGHLNDMAVKDKARRTKVSDEEVRKLYNADEGDVISIFNAVKRGVAKYFPQINIKEPIDKNVDTIGEALETAIEQIANKLIEDDCKIVKQENRNEGVRIAATCALCLLRLLPKRVALSLKNQELTDKSYFELRTVINKIVRLVDENIKDMNESKNRIDEKRFETLDSVDDLLSMIGMNKEEVPKTGEEEISEVKNDFNTIMDRLNNVKL